MRKQPAAVLAGASAAALASVALFAAPASAHTPHHTAPAAHGVVFVQNDDVKGNAVVTYDRAGDGSLTRAGTYATGGLGGQEEGTGPDHLASQGSLAYDKAHRRLYAVNAGSDTLTVFAVRGDRLVREQTVSTGGSFPVSVTVHGGSVYVLNALDGGSVQGYLNIGGRLVRVPSLHRDLGIKGDGTPGQVSFTPDGSKIVVAGKANNTLAVFRVGLLGMSARPTSTVLPSGGAPFALTFDAEGRAVVADASANSLDTFAVRRGGSLTKVDEAATGQQATCWVVRDGRFFYTGNAASGTISGFAQRHGRLTHIGDTPSGAGTVDLAVSSDGTFLYAQVGTTGSVTGFRVHADGSLTDVGSVTVPNAVGGEGIAAS
ncbi:lactonase family protein [Streptomyces sp. NRRL F-5126]|uniref:lactonase family protein n=1 Tax=Streptomyces sp. NRRL F-5126 TaxID=1463857 RepID=UPI0004C655A2|nr:beta-propeller fold lactonase family protein [Streptomyces sp. NRRL F-5126]